MPELIVKKCGGGAAIDYKEKNFDTQGCFSFQKKNTVSLPVMQRISMVTFLPSEIIDSCKFLKGDYTRIMPLREQNSTRHRARKSLSFLTDKFLQQRADDKFIHLATVLLNTKYFSPRI
uniref:Uncharacterized protein n=1 Tax=Romanomermis culicivorax TaxID=13658 RepID=A0A915J5J8_ROMCU